MPSPFPGMDPYIESSGLWYGFHLCMLSAMQASLNACLPERYAACINEYKLIDDLWGYHRYLRIDHLPSKRTLTILELLTLAQKEEGSAQRKYLARRERLVKKVNLVEIDLLRSGDHLPVPGAAESGHSILETLLHRQFRTRSWVIPLRESLPSFEVPLHDSLATVPSVPLPLQKCLERVYDEGRYSSRIRYTKPLKPPLNEADDAWARQLLASRRLQP